MIIPLVFLILMIVPQISMRIPLIFSDSNTDISMTIQLVVITDISNSNKHKMISVKEAS